MNFSVRLVSRWIRVACLAACAWGADSGALPQKPVVPQAKKPAPPNVILITLDTTRADRMDFLGSSRALTPNLDTLAKQSAVFTRAYAQAPLTPASHATILTGTYPQFHQVKDFRLPLAKGLPYAPAILHAQGYRTAAFVGSIVLDPSPSYAPGFDRGFDTYDSNFHYQGPGEDHYRSVERRGGQVVSRALSWLTRHPKGPFFVWVHLYDPHDPYDPPEPYKTKYAAEPYDGEIAYTDSAVGKLLEALKTRGLYDNTVIAVMADHGEGLGAHGEETHGVFLYDETIHVPLVIKLAHSADGKRIDNRVELVDVLPTLLQSVGVPIPRDVQGTSLLGLINPPDGNDGKSVADAAADRPAYSETDYPHLAFGWSAERSLRTGKYLYIQAPKRELYDEGTDPQANHNLAPQSGAVADTLANRLQTFRDKTGSQREAPKAAIDPAAQEKLAALGYVASRTSDTRASDPDQGADPKDKIEISNLTHRASALRERGRFKEAAALLEKIIASEPTLPGMYAKLGDNLLDLQQYDKAIPVWRKAAQLDPKSPMAHTKLAMSLMGAGDFAGAVPELELALAEMPNFAEAHVALEMAYARTNRIPETIKECKIVLQFLPDHFGSYLILGRFLELSGDLEGAIPNLKKAAELQPQAPEPHMILADVYDRLGRSADAARERAKVEGAAASSK